MARDARHADIRLDVDPAHPTSAAPLEERPFRIAVLGDFSARGVAGGTRDAPPQVSPVRVDRDDLETVLARFAPQLAVGGSDIVFTSLDDFHPDHVHEHLPALAPLHALREDAASPRRRAASAPEAGDGPVLDRILDAMPGSMPDLGTIAESRDLAGYLRRIVEPHLIDHPTADQAAAVAQVDAAIAAVIRAFLHQPEVQALESLWRGLDLLVRRVETSSDLTIHVVDITYDEATRDPEGLADRLRKPGGWAAVLCCYTVSADSEVLAALPRIAALGRRLGAPVLLGASPDLAAAAVRGTPTAASTGEDPSGWRQVRRGPDAAFLGLCHPRVLLRLPYGPDTDTCERFAFDEMPEGPDHRHYLWGEAALLCGVLLAEAFTNDGWGMRPGQALEVARLPLHLWRDAGGTTHALPCTESALDEDAAVRLLDSGIMPVVAIRGQDTARLLRFQSVADPPAALAGPWTRR
ncbi:MAG: type VI secretion system contractile sheath large subunit [Gemmatimonadota bacterium]|nr:type VI secretion system contractile sheath large subunit [Gemmatimonadota bacterium]